MASRERLLAEKLFYISQTQITVRDNEKLTDHNVALEGKVNELKLENEHLREQVKATPTRKTENEVLKAENERLKRELADSRKRTDEMREQQEISRKAAEEQELEMEALKEKYAALSAMESDLKQQAAEYGQLLGHQNHNQKIKYMVKLKGENAELKTKVTRLERELAMARRKSAMPSTGTAGGTGRNKKKEL